jgi:N-ethylmaleimide reductase
MTGVSIPTPTLFQTLRAGELLLPNRVVMAPMTRNRATIDGTPTDLMARYYAQRATAGLIITEATTPTADGTAAPMMPGLYTDAHERGWRHVAETVHAAGGLIVVQLSHAGRATHPSLIGDLAPLAPSPIAAHAEVFTAAGPRPASEPRELTDDELAAVPGWFADAAQRAIRAGADGVELHAGNGFLINQFLDPVANQRSDLYGHDRTRLLADVVDAVGTAIGRGRVGVRMSPGSDYNDMRDDAPRATLAHVAATLPRDIAYLHVIAGPMSPTEVRASWPQTLLINGPSSTHDDVTRTTLVNEGTADAVTFAQAFLANPDLPRRLHERLPLNAPDPATFYGGGHKGYLDYPPHAPAAVAA